MSVWHMQPDIAASRRQHKQLYQVQGRYLRYVGLVALACVLYYVWFFLQFGISGEQLTTGLQQIGRYLARMFVWHDFWNWPFGYYFTQIGITLAIVFAGTLTATVLALLLSFFAARNIMRGVVLGTLALLMRRLFDVLRGIDMAIWGLIFVRAVGLACTAQACRLSGETHVVVHIERASEVVIKERLIAASEFGLVAPAKANRELAPFKVRVQRQQRVVQIK